MQRVEMTAGRPTDYSPELAAVICEQIAEGFSIRTICKEESMPCAAAVFNWLRKYPEFVEQYEKAKEQQADAFAEDMVDIADDGSNDWMAKEDKDGNNIGWQLNGEHVQRSRLRIDTRKWIASKLKPKKYGEKTVVETTTPDGSGVNSEQKMLDMALKIAFVLHQGVKVKGLTLDQPVKDSHDVDPDRQTTDRPPSGG